jgi:hypothetical protein
MDSKAKREKRRPYEKPKLRVIELAAEEVLGIGCKIGGEGASGISTCAGGGCSAPGGS